MSLLGQQSIKWVNTEASILCQVLILLILSLVKTRFGISRDKN